MSRKWKWTAWLACTLAVLLLLAGCAPFSSLLMRQVAGSRPAESHWVTKEIVGGIQQYTGDLELYLNDDGTAFARFRDYNVRDYAADAADYQRDENGTLYNEYGLFYTWSQTGGRVVFQPLDAENYSVGENLQLVSENVKQEAEEFAIGKGKLNSDGTMSLSFGFTYAVEEGWTNPQEEYFILEQAAGMSGQETITTKAEAQEELDGILSKVESTEQFCNQLIRSCPEKIARVYTYNNYDKINPLFFTLDKATALYGGGATMAVVSTALYPAYAESGTVELDGIAAELLASPYAACALLYEKDAPPSKDIMTCFAELRPGGADQAADMGALQDFFYRYGSGFSAEPPMEYELMALDMMEADGDGKALLYIREYDQLLDGYPVEVPAATLTELEELLYANGVESWEGEFEPEQMVTDGYGYYMALQYEGRSWYSTGYEAYPEGYQAGHEAIVAFLEGLRAAQDEQIYAERKESQLGDVAGIESVYFYYGATLDPEIADINYQIQREADGTLALTLTEGETLVKSVPLDDAAVQEILRIFEEHNVYAWDGYNESIIGEEGNGRFFILNCLLSDSRENWMNYSAYGFGAAPDGYAAFEEDFRAVLEQRLRQ